MSVSSAYLEERGGGGPWVTFPNAPGREVVSRTGLADRERADEQALEAPAREPRGFVLEVVSERSGILLSREAAALPRRRIPEIWIVDPFQQHLRETRTQDTRTDGTG